METLRKIYWFCHDALEALFPLLLLIMVLIGIGILLLGLAAGGAFLLRDAFLPHSASPAFAKAPLSRPAPPPTSSAITMPDEVEYAVADTKGQIICWCDLTGCYAAPGVTQAPMPAEGPHVP